MTSSSFLFSHEIPLPKKIEVKMKAGPMTSLFISLVILGCFSQVSMGGPVAFAVCQTACNAGWVSCYATAGLVAGTVSGGLAAPLAAAGCNVAQGLCMAACGSLLIAPTP
ncbi:hypothetical protein G9A89_003368 [Geosiphon pyriformis]|nr:hypothetical protein G9A89_003368 [Geosiphon pyriformis]